MDGRPGDSLAGSRRSSRRRRRTEQRSTTVVPDPSERRQWLRTLLTVVLCMILIAAPLPMGANRVWAWTALEFLLFGLGLVWYLSCPDGRSLLPIRAGDPLFLMIVVWLVYQTLYLVPLPLSVIRVLSPAVHDSYAKIYEATGTLQTLGWLTLDRHATTQALLKHLMYLSGFLLTAALLTTRGRVKLMLYAMMTAGVLQVLLGLFARETHLDLVPRHLLDGHWDILRGTFVNRNHFAAFLAMSASAGIGLFLCYLKRGYAVSSIRLRIAEFVERASGPILVAGAGVALIGAGIILSTSRGGAAALMVGLVLTLLVALAARGWKSRELAMIWPLGGAIAAGVAWAGSRDLIDRIFTTSPVIEERWVQWQATTDLIRDSWLTGVGPGVYQYAFAAYKDERFRPLLYDHAHNDYLELLSNQGLIGTLLLWLIVSIVLCRLVRAFWRRSDIVVRGALFAGLTGMLAMLTHSLVEFNFQIPSNALYFWTLAGVGLAAARLPREQHDGYRPHRRSGRPSGESA